MGTNCGLFEIKKHGDEYFTYLVECKDPKACTIVLRGASKDILKEVREKEREMLFSFTSIFYQNLNFKWFCILLAILLVGGTESSGCYAGSKEYNG